MTQAVGAIDKDMYFLSFGTETTFVYFIKQDAWCVWGFSMDASMNYIPYSGNGWNDNFYFVKAEGNSILRFSNGFSTLQNSRMYYQKQFLMPSDMVIVPTEFQYWANQYNTGQGSAWGMQWRILGETGDTLAYSTGGTTLYNPTYKFHHFYFPPSQDHVSHYLTLDLDMCHLGISSQDSSNTFQLNGYNLKANLIGIDEVK